MDIILLLVAAYFLISLTALTDKFLLTKALPQPVAYAFFVSVLGLAAVVLTPFDWGHFIAPTPLALGLSLLAGIGYTVALLWLYSALRFSEVSRAFTTAGSLGAVLTFLFSFQFLGERLLSRQVVGFLFLVIGAVLISLDSKRGKTNYRGLLFAVAAAVAFGVSYTATKAVYIESSFIAGFAWIRIFAFLTIGGFLLVPKNLAAVKQALAERAPIRSKTTQLTLAAGQSASAAGFLILNYVISLSSAAIALAAQGLQYVFLFIFGIILTKKFPQVLTERITPPVVWQKAIAILCIASGLAFLAFR